MDILLVRHGEAAAEWGEHADPGLSERGREQAIATARILREEVDGHWQLLSSPRARALETAAPLAAGLGMSVATNAAFSEIPAPVPLVQRKSWLREFMTQSWDTQPEGLCQWRDGVLDGLARLERPTVVFSHFLVINAVVGAATGRRETLCFWPDNASVTRLRYGGEGLALVELGRSMKTVVNL